MERVLVVGPAGAGKTTFAAALARATGLPHIELDSIYHQPGWTALPDSEFRERVARATRSNGWIVDGNYASTLQDILWSRADTIIWLDLPRGVATSGEGGGRRQPAWWIFALALTAGLAA